MKARFRPSGTTERRLQAACFAVTMALLVGLGALVAGCSNTETAASLANPTSTTVAATTTEAPTTTTHMTTTTAAPTTTVAAPAEVRPESDLVLCRRVSDGTTLTLDMYFPAQPEEAPIVIEPGLSAMEGLVEQGMIVVDIADTPLPAGTDEEILADRAFIRASAEKLAGAIRLARAKAAEVGNEDPTVVLSGLSFWGGMAVQVALFGDTLDARWEEFAALGGPPRQLDCEVTEGSTDVDIVIGQAATIDAAMPIFDGSKYGRAYYQEHDPEMQEFLASAIGANPELTVRLIHGTSDFIPVEDPDEFVRVLTDSGYDAQVITWPGPHTWAPTELFLSTLTEALGR